MPFALTTFDNPFHPTKDFMRWYRFDMDHGYNTCSYLNRIAQCSEALTEKENDYELERAIDKIVRDDPFNIYRKVEVEDE